MNYLEKSGIVIILVNKNFSNSGLISPFAYSIEKNWWQKSNRKERKRNGLEEAMIS